MFCSWDDTSSVSSTRNKLIHIVSGWKQRSQITQTNVKCEAHRNKHLVLRFKCIPQCCCSVIWDVVLHFMWTCETQLCSHVQDWQKVNPHPATNHLGHFQIEDLAAQILTLWRTTCWLWIRNWVHDVTCDTDWWVRDKSMWVERVRWVEAEESNLILNEMHTTYIIKTVSIQLVLDLFAWISHCSFYLDQCGGA